MNASTSKFIFALLVGTSLEAHGALYYTEGAWTSGFANSGGIADGNAAGWSDTRIVSDVAPGLTIGDVNITLTLSGGYNGDLYAYLSHDGVLLPLLNRVGSGTGSEPTYYFGYADAGFNAVSLSDCGTVNIHNYGGGGVPSGNYSPDSGGLTFAGTFAGANPNGHWTLFLSDLSAGGGQSQLASWSLEITAVPEPANVALGIFGAGSLVVMIAKSRRVRKWVQGRRHAIVEWIDAV
jgi:hypothetical protein